MTPGRFCSTPQNPQTTSFQVKSLARLSLSHAGGARLPRRQPSLASLVAQRHYLRSASLAIRPRRVPQAPSVFACVAHHRDGAPNHSRVSRAYVPSASAFRAVDLRLCRHDGRCLRFASPPFLSRRAPQAPSVFDRIARRQDGVRNHSRVSRACVSSACALSSPSTFACVARRHDGVACVSRLSRSHLGVPPRRRRPSLASLVVATTPQTTRATLTLACRGRAHPAPLSFSHIARCYDGRCLRFASPPFPSRRAPRAPPVFA